jgi:peptidyl-prolyl cis-trans isomerase B (cyclophilin B)
MSGPLPRVFALLAMVLVAALLSGCGGEDDRSAEALPVPTAEEPASPSEAAGCETVEAPAPKGEGNLRKPSERLERGKTYVATVSTSCGEFEFTLDSRRAPRTGGSFKYMADQKLYDGLTFHRISAGFVIQGGDPKGDGTGGPGYTVVEPPPADLTYDKGVVAMAKAANEPAGASGSQFFVVTAESTPLEPDYALLGKVTKGQEVVDRIGVLPTTPDEQPVEPVVIESITVAER